MVIAHTHVGGGSLDQYMINVQRIAFARTRVKCGRGTTVPLNLISYFLARAGMRCGRELISIP